MWLKTCRDDVPFKLSSNSQFILVYKTAFGDANYNLQLIKSLEGEVI